MKPFIFAGLILCLINSAYAETSMTCEMIDDFSAPKSLETWRAVNDGVMGGRSSGGGVHDGTSMVFSGTINTNGGGFSSMRRPLSGEELEGASHIKVMARTDGRSYELTFRSHRRNWGRPVSYRGALIFEGDGSWQEATVAIDNMDSFVFGRSVSAPVLDRAKAETIGIILADGQDGPFRLDVAWIKVCR